MKIIIVFFILFQFIVPQVFELDENEKKYNFRLSYGEALYSALGQIFLEGTIEKDFQEGKFIGIEIERYLEKNKYKDSFDFGIQGGFFWHKQDILTDQYTQPYSLKGQDIFQLNFGLKITFKNFPWKKYVKTKFSLVEGLSYTSSILDIERENINKKTLNSKSKLLNYLEFSLAFDLGSMLNLEGKGVEDTYIGIGVSHRSGIFGTFNNVDGGSNFLMFFIEKEI